MQTMSRDEWRAFLLHATRTAKLATVREDGRPHVVPVWFDLDGDTLLFPTGKDSVKGKNLRRDPRVVICVDDERPPFAYVTIEGKADVQEASAEQLLPWTTRLASRYMGAQNAQSIGRRNAVDGELLVRVPLDKVTAYREIAG
jgi:PPOX class probable F420-dependent enzyme